jgi:hypothetical protein
MEKTMTNAAITQNINTEEENAMDELAEYLEYISRTTPTTMPEWMD